MTGNCCSLACVLCLSVILLGGCRREGRSEPSGGSERPGPAGRETPEDATSRGPGAGDVKRELTGAEREALSTIQSAGGRVAGDTDGLPLEIDLASDRVFASEAVVLAVLQFPHLQTLRLATSNVPPETLSRLAELTGLRELMLQDALLTDDGLSSLLRANPELERLTLRRLSQITDRGIERVANCPGLRVLALIEMNQLSGTALETLRQAGGLRSLDLRNCGRLTGEDFRRLLALTRLTELKLGGPMINDDVISVVAQHPAIDAIAVEDAQISGACLQCLSQTSEFARRLRSLAFARCFGINDDSLGCLSAFPALQTLVLRDLMLSGKFLAQSADKPLSLRTLVMTDAFITDAALKSLPDLCPRLTRLDLRGNLGVTDASLDVLRKITTLKQVQLERTGVTGGQGVTEGKS